MATTSTLQIQYARLLSEANRLSSSLYSESDSPTWKPFLAQDRARLSALADELVEITQHLRGRMPASVATTPTALITSASTAIAQATAILGQCGSPTAPTKTQVKEAIRTAIDELSKV